MVAERQIDSDAEVLVNEALEVAIDRGDSQAVIDLLTITSEYIDGANGDEYTTPPDNVRAKVLPDSYPVDEFTASE